MRHKIVSGENPYCENCLETEEDLLEEGNFECFGSDEDLIVARPLSIGHIYENIYYTSSYLRLPERAIADLSWFRPKK